MLPEIPFRDGPLAPAVVYPPEDAAIAVRDSNFIFGSVGTGRARLWINGAPVPVEPNGAFLAFLPVPPDGVYRLDAVADGDTARLERTVRIPEPPPQPMPGRAVIVAGSVFPRGGWTALAGERIEVGFRGTAGGRAALVFPDGSRVPLVESGTMPETLDALRTFGVDPGRLERPRATGLADYRGFFAALPLVAADTAVRRPTLAEPWHAAPIADGPVEPQGRADGGARGDRPETGALVELVVGTDTARAPLPLNLAVLDPRRPRVGVGFDAGPAGQSDGVVVARPGPGTTSHYFWPDGTELTITGERNGEYRVRLAPELNAWVPAAEVRLLPPGVPPPGGIVGTVRLTPEPGFVDARFAVRRRLPSRVDVDDRRLVVTLFGGISGTDWLQYGALDPFIERAEWSQPQDSVYRLTLELGRTPWGWTSFWAENGDLVVRVRRPPDIDPRRPLAGRRIVVDPGHGGAETGAPGPTSLSEADANLAIALQLRDLLERAGARVLMTRTDDRTVPLYARTVLAESANAEILISVHNNAFPDGVNPFVNSGTSTYYFHPQSADLARGLQRELLAELGLRNLGVGRSSLALVRPRWMPSTLTETMFMMIPRQEAALRDPAVQRRIAEAHVRALEAFLAERAAEGR